ncbi:hypothetical protein BCR33DRAFT_739400 [Rhizoclosmatium globosum]|uniref:Uncharacterized protein n=1 Tax=Rhizoclosmatium globosum TaxID=329046 RepID=A0A1Y2C6E6_9FUNG|nr:hypothetical protein BCR33DRAFT_739400 [Rhizoclosmatium globosum]|eukprot:ORY41855.1 hypothetical protein BCR33DRAFT_739400 [Rhizoclosmatium globosum]
MDRGSLHYLLLQSILELKTEFNTKADKLISLLNSGFEKDSSVEISGRWLQSQTEKQNCSSLSSPHVEYGLRWDAQDFLVESEANISAPPPLFKTKPDKPSKSNKQSTLSLKKNHGSDSFNLLTEFNAFRQQKYGSVHSITQPLPELRENVQEKPVGNASQLDRDKTILVTESAKPVKPNWRSSLTMKKSKWADSPRNSTYRSSGDNFNINRCVSFQREVQNKRENVQQRPPNDVSPIASEISSSESLSMYSTDANVSTDSFDSEHLQEFMSEVKGSGPGLSKLRESVVVKPQTSVFNVSEIDALPPPEMHTLVNRSVLFKPKESQ